MRKTATAFLGVLLLTCVTAVAHANIYPPGPGGTCPDTLTISQIQSALAGMPTGTCTTPVVGDSVRGVKGIVIGFDPHSAGFAVYFEESSGADWSGIDAFTGGNNFAGSLALGDEIAVYGKIDDYQGETEIDADDGAFGSNLIIRKISSGNPLPPFKVLTPSQLAFNAAAEKYEGMLVKINTQMRVVRNSGIGFNIFAMVDNTGGCPDGGGGVCDTVVVDGATLSNPLYAPPANGTVVTNVQGIVNQRTGGFQSGAGYRIQLRDGNDITTPTPPNLNDAFSVDADTIRVIFDRDVTAASAEDVGNYSLQSFGFINSATLVEPNVVHLAVTNGLATGDPEGVSVNGIVGQASGVPMTTQQSTTFYNGVLDITDLQAPDPDSLTMSVIGCEDRSRYSGVGTVLGERTTYRGVVVAQYGPLYYLQDANNPGAIRSGIASYAPIAPLTVGNQYLFAGAIQEYFSETEASGNVYLRDEGPAAVAAPVTKDMSIFLDTSCDATQSYESADDYEGQLVRITGVHVVNEVAAGQGFYVGEDAPNFEGSINVRDRSNSIVTFDADLGHAVEVTGILGQFGGIFDIDPRNDADIVDLSAPNPAVDAPLGGLKEIKFAVYPNPARLANVSLGLPKAANVDLGVFDLLGRRVATLASGNLSAGEHSYTWSGLQASGKRSPSGVYFYKLKVGNEIRTLRGVLVD